MINTDQLNRMIDARDELYNCAIDLATHDHDELLAICTHAQSLHTLAEQYDCSPAVIARIAQYLTLDTNYAEFCASYELCPTHRCDHEICYDNGLHPYRP